MKIRKSRWGHREFIKEAANRHNARSYEHPQVVRQMEEADYQELEQQKLRYDIHVYDDGFEVVDPWNQPIERKPLNALDRTITALEAMRFDHEVIDHRVTE